MYLICEHIKIYYIFQKQLNNRSKSRAISLVTEIIKLKIKEKFTRYNISISFER